MELKIEYLPIDELQAYERNAKLHPAEQIEQIKKSIQDYGFRDPVGVWQGQIVEGHGRVLAAKELGFTEIPVIRLDDMTDEQRREYALVHNQTTMNSGFDFSILNGELEGLPDFDAEFYGFEIQNAVDFVQKEEQKGSMAKKYLVPPFSVIYTNKPDWLVRKRAWVDKGLRSEIGRGDKLAFNSKKNIDDNFAADGMIKQTKTKDMELKNNTIARMLQMKGERHGDTL